jgi:hypothetical protein
MSIGKRGVLLCDGCELPIQGERLTLSYQSLQGSVVPSSQMDFCSSACLAEHLYDEIYLERTNTEINNLRALLCPDCWEKTA